MREMHELLQVAREDAPPPRFGVEDIVAAGRRRQRWALAQRIGGAGTITVAAVTAGVLVAGNLALSGGNSASRIERPAADRATSSPAPFMLAAPPFSFTFDGYRLGAYRVMAPDEVNPDYQATYVLRDGKDAKGKPAADYVARLVVYRPGAFSAKRLETDTGLTMNGRDAYQGVRERQSIRRWNRDYSVTGPQGGEGTSTVSYDLFAWQYAPDAWAVLTEEAHAKPDLLPVADLRALAERFALRAGEPVRARLPFRAGYLPAGYELQGVRGQSMTAAGSGMFTAVFGVPDPSAEPLTEEVDVERARNTPTLVIGLLWVDRPPPDAKKRTSRCNEGRFWCMRTLPGNEFFVTVEDPTKKLSDAELLKVADALEFANIKKDNAWVPIA
jgi:hypothetical protein